MILPLMPKGVEHKLTLTDLTDEQLVILPLMPKGVEHITFEGFYPRSLALPGNEGTADLQTSDYRLV